MLFPPEGPILFADTSGVKSNSKSILSADIFSLADDHRHFSVLRRKIGMRHPMDVTGNHVANDDDFDVESIAELPLGQCFSGETVGWR